jgi:hypothetical protein
MGNFSLLCVLRKQSGAPPRGCESALIIVIYCIIHVRVAPIPSLLIAALALVFAAAPHLLGRSNKTNYKRTPGAPLIRKLAARPGLITDSVSCRSRTPEIY